MLHSLVKIPEKAIAGEEDMALSSAHSKPSSSVEGEVLKNKVRFVSRMMRMYRTLREENESIVRLKGMCPDNRIPRGLLLEGGDAIKDGNCANSLAMEAFKKAKELDIKNEMRPE